MAQLIAPGTTLVNSADFTLTTGQSATLFLTDAVGPQATKSGTAALVQIKSSTGQYFTVGELTSAAPASVLQAVGTFRVSRLAGRNAIGVDKI